MTRKRVRHRRTRPKRQRSLGPHSLGRSRPSPTVDTMDVNGKSVRVEWNGFKPDTQQRVWMRPREFLALATPPIYGTMEYPFAFSETSLRVLDHDILERDEPLYSLRLDVNQIPGRSLGTRGDTRPSGP